MKKSIKHIKERLIKDIQLISNSLSSETRMQGLNSIIQAIQNNPVVKNALFLSGGELYELVRSNIDMVPVEILSVWFMHADLLDDIACQAITERLKNAVPAPHWPEFRKITGKIWASLPYSHFSRVNMLSKNALLNLARIHPEKIYKLELFLGESDSVFKEAVELGIDAEDYMAFLKNPDFTELKRIIVIDAYIKNKTHDWIIVDDLFLFNGTLPECSLREIKVMFCIKHELIEELIKIINSLSIYATFQYYPYLTASFIDKYHKYFTALPNSKKAPLLIVQGIENTSVYEDAVISYLKTKIKKSLFNMYGRKLRIPDHIIKRVGLSWAENAIQRLLDSPFFTYNRETLEERVALLTLARPGIADILNCHLSDPSQVSRS